MGQRLMESIDALWRILILMLDRLQTRYVWVLIDAIDECDQADWTTLLQSLRNWITQTQGCRFKTYHRLELKKDVLYAFFIIKNREKNAL
jgi:hypothetical protein